MSASSGRQTTRIYLDHQATTPVAPEVLERMLPFFCETFGNAHSKGHGFGWEAEKAVDAARRRVAELVEAEPSEIIFTSGATEANNLALFGLAEKHGETRRHIISQVTEHPAVLGPLEKLESQGFAVTLLGVDERGRVDPGHVAQALTEQTLLVSVMHANNEIGTVQPIAEIGSLCRERGVFFHVDAAQTVGKLPVSMHTQSIDLLSISAHKFYGPKGIGALCARRRGPRAFPAAQIVGGGQERGIRSGTLNVPAIVGFGAACDLAAGGIEAEVARLGSLSELILRKLEGALGPMRLNGPGLTERLPGNLSLVFPVEAEQVMLGARRVAVATGAACASNKSGPSHVLQAIGLSPQQCHRSVRIGLGRTSTSEQATEAADLLIAAAREGTQTRGQ